MPSIGCCSVDKATLALIPALVMEPAIGATVAFAFAPFDRARCRLALALQELRIAAALPAPIVHKAKAEAVMLPLATFDAATSADARIVRPELMLRHVLRNRHKFEILNPVVILHLIDVVNKFALEKRSAKMFGHHITMLKNVAMGIAVGMAGPKKKHIPISINGTPWAALHAPTVMPLDEANRLALSPSASGRSVLGNGCWLSASALAKPLIHAARVTEIKTLV